MAGTKDFEERRRDRLKQQRKQRERMRVIKLILAAVLFVLIVIIIIAGISRCSKNKHESEGSPVDSVTQTESPAVASELPVSDTAAASDIPAPAAGANDLLTVLKNSGQTDCAYLTFENGPDEMITPQILDILRRYNIKATFFMNGKQIEKNPQLCARIVQEGHLAAVSSYTGVYSTIYSNEASFMSEINKTYELITKNSPGGAEPFKLCRFPGGSGYTSTGKLAERLAEQGFYHCDWNCSNGDEVNGVTKTAENLLYYFNKNKPQLNNLVIQLHDSSGKQTTVDMLANLIQQLLDDGRTFKRLDEIDFSNSSATVPPQSAEVSGAGSSAASGTSTSAPSSPGAQPSSENAQSGSGTNTSPQSSSGGSAASSQTKTSSGSSKSTGSTSSGSSSGKSTSNSSGGSASPSGGSSSAQSGGASSGTQTGGASSGTQTGGASSGTQTGGSAAAPDDNGIPVE